MDERKMGLFIKQLREEKSMTQAELANKLYVSREAVSRWENGRACPDKQTMLSLAKILNISIEELLCGERHPKQKIEEVTLDVLEAKQRIHHKFKKAIVTIIVLLFLLFSYYFINNYNSIKIYTFRGENKSVAIADGIFVMTKDKIYFHLGNVTSHKKIKKLKLYVDEKQIYETDNNDITLYDFYGYNAYFNYDTYKKDIKNMYVDIINEEDETSRIHLIFQKDFSNNNIFSKKRKPIGYGQSDFSWFKPIVDIEPIKQKLKPTDDGYLLVDKEKNMTYIFLEEELTFVMKNYNTEEEVQIDLHNMFFVYTKYENHESKVIFDYDGNNIKFHKGDYEKPLEIISNYYTILKEIAS